MIGQTQNSNFYGVRIDEETHNWVIFRNEINLGFSYMTFAIQEVFEEINLSSESYLFDIEGFNWVLNRNTYFTNNDGLVMQQDFKKTDFMLKSFENVDPDLLEIIHYIDSDQKCRSTTH